MNLVSIIIPLYNAEKRIRKTLESALSQTYQNIEIIVVDDSSTDSSYTIAKGYEKKGIVLLRQENSGAANARNMGIAFATGKYIQFLDAGDIICKDKIKTQVDALKKEPEKVAVSNYKQFTSEDELFNNVYPDQSSFIYSSDNPQDFLINLWGGFGYMNFIQTNSWLIPRELIEKAGIWRSYRCPDDDGEFFARILLASSGIVHTKNVYNYYHDVQLSYDQLSKNKNRKHLQNSLLTIDLKHQYLLQKGDHSFIKKAIAFQYYRIAIDMYPSQKVLSAIAYKRYKELNIASPKLILGGRIVETIKIIFGWRVARFVRYYLRGV